jgi:hypothetical protein
MCFAAVTLPKIAVTIVVIRNVKCSRVCATHLYYSILNQSVIIIKNILEGGVFNDQGFCLIAFWNCCIFPLDVLTKAILEGSSATQTIKSGDVDVVQILSISSKDALGWCFVLLVLCCFV